MITSHGIIEAALAHNATVQSRTEGDKKLTPVAFTILSQLMVSAIINDRNLVEKVESWGTNPAVGDMLVETTYTDYRDFDGVKFPTKIMQKTGGFPALDLTVTAVQPNAAADIQVPDNVRQTAVQVQTQQVVVVEGPQNNERATAVIEEVKRMVPNKPIKYRVNSHHHFDHAAGPGALPPQPLLALCKPGLGDSLALEEPGGSRALAVHAAPCKRCRGWRLGGCLGPSGPRRGGRHRTAAFSHRRAGGKHTGRPRTKAFHLGQ